MSFFHLRRPETLGVAALAILVLVATDAYAQSSKKKAAKVSIFSDDYVSSVRPSCKEGPSDKRLRSSEENATPDEKKAPNPDKAK